MPQDSCRDSRPVVLIVDEGSNPFELACVCEVFGARRRHGLLRRSGALPAELRAADLDWTMPRPRVGLAHCMLAVLGRPETVGQVIGIAHLPAPARGPRKPTPEDTRLGESRMTEQGTGGRLPEWALMYLLHDAFRRDLDALAATRASLAAVRARWDVFRDQLVFHHVAEDQVMWPPMRARLAGDPDGLAVIDAMEDEHAQIDPLLDAVDGALAAGGGQARLAGPLSRLHTTVTGHLAHEEADALPLISKVMTPAGVAGMFEVFGKMGGLKRGKVMMPWALSDADPETRAQVLSHLPPPARLLHRVVWAPRYRRRTPPL